jgi:puromycin-sensitive aminopeptidase
MEVRNAEQASERFDAITYLKGMAVLRMIESFIGAEAFRKGVNIYLNRHAEGNATADDFWTALDEASGQDVSSVANLWIFEPGHPLVTCGALVTADGLEVELTQGRFFFDPDVPPTNQRWLIPMVIKYGTADGIKEERLLMDGERATVRLPGATWYYPNAGGRGFYRYAMDDESLSRLASSVRELAPEERLMLVDNQWALTRAGKANLSQLFALIAGLRGEQDRAVLDAISDPISWLATHAVPDDRMPEFQRFVAEFFQPVLDTLGWEVRPDDTTEDKERRARAMSVLGRIAQAPSVLEEARRRILDHLEGRSRLDPDVASALAGVAAVRGDVALFERYVARMKEVETTDAQEEARFRNALIAFEDPGLVRRVSEACFGELIRLQDRGLMLSGLLGSRHARRITWPIVRDHWETGVAPLDPGGKHRIISGLGQLTPRDLEADVARFIEEKRTPDSEEIIAQTLERLHLGADAAERLAGELPRALARLEQPLI